MSEPTNIELKPDQCAVVFNADGSHTFYFPFTNEGIADRQANEGEVAATAVAVFLASDDIRKTVEERMMNIARDTAGCSS